MTFEELLDKFAANPYNDRLRAELIEHEAKLRKTLEGIAGGLPEPVHQSFAMWAQMTAQRALGDAVEEIDVIEMH